MKPKTVGRARGQASAQPNVTCAGIGPGSIVLTQSGETPIEDIVPGARVITRAAGLVTVREVRKHRLTTRTVRILAGSLGMTRPDRDVVLPADQGVLVRDWRAEAMFGAPQAMVPASALIDGAFITDEGVQTLTLYCLDFDTPQVIYADGLEVASGPASAVQSDAA